MLNPVRFATGLLDGLLEDHAEQQHGRHEQEMGHAVAFVDDAGGAG